MVDGRRRMCPFAKLGSDVTSCEQTHLTVEQRVFVTFGGDRAGHLLRAVGELERRFSGNLERERSFEIREQIAIEIGTRIVRGGDRCGEASAIDLVRAARVRWVGTAR